MSFAPDGAEPVIAWGLRREHVACVIQSAVAMSVADIRRLFERVAGRDQVTA